MAQNMFTAEQIQAMEQRRRSQPQINVAGQPQGQATQPTTQTGFEPVQNALSGGQNAGGDMQAGMAQNQPQMGLGGLQIAGGLSSYPQASPSAQIGAGANQETGFGQSSGQQQELAPGDTPMGSGQLPNLPQMAQGRWQSRGIDFDGLLKAGVAKSMQDETIGQDMWQRQQAADLNLKYISGAGEQMRPQQIGTEQDIKILGELMRHPSLLMGGPEAAGVQAQINQLMTKLGLAPVATQAPQTNQVAGEQANMQPPVENGTGKAFASGFGPAAGTVAGTAIGNPVAKAGVGQLVKQGTKMVGQQGVKGLIGKGMGAVGGTLGTVAGPAGTVGGAIVGNMVGDKIVDAIWPDNDVAAQQHPTAQAVGFGVGLGANKMAKGVYNKFKGGGTPPPAPNSTTTPTTEIMTQPPVTGFSPTMPATPKFRTDMGPTPKIGATPASKPAAKPAKKPTDKK